MGIELYFCMICNLLFSQGDSDFFERNEIAI